MSCLTACIELLFGSSSADSTSYNSVSSINTTSHAPTEDTRSAAAPSSSSQSSSSDSSHGNSSKQGWIYLVSRAALVPIRTKVYATVYDDCLFCHDREKQLSNVADVEGAVVVMAMAGAALTQGASAASTTLGMSSPYGFVIKGQSMSVELDADNLPNQKDWLAVIKTAIETANINVVTASDGGLEAVNKGVSVWYQDKMKSRAEAIGRLRPATPMSKHYISLGRRKDHERLVSIDEAGKIVTWSSNSANASDAGNDKEVTVDSIQEVLEGTRTKVLSSLSSEPTRAACCWSIVTNSRTVDFEAQAVSEKERWVDNLRTIISVNRLEATIAKNKKLRKPRGGHKIL